MFNFTLTKNSTCTIFSDKNILIIKVYGACKIFKIEHHLKSLQNIAQISFLKISPCRKNVIDKINNHTIINLTNRFITSQNLKKTLHKQ